MSERSSRRRLRLRRKRKDESFGARLSDSGDVADPGGSERSSGRLGAADAAEVVGHMGCCVVEAIGSAAVLAALLTVPAVLLMR